MHCTAETLQTGVVAEALLREAQQLVKAERACVLRFDEEDEVRVLFSLGFNGTAPEEGAYSRTILADVRSSGLGRIFVDASSDPRFEKADSVHIHQLRSVLVAPITNGEVVIGALWMDNRMRAGAFRFEQLDLVSELCLLTAT